MITGFTSNKLDVVSTYNRVTPYVIGVNGVTGLDYDPVTLTAVTRVYYTIGDINYITTLTKKPVNDNSSQAYLNNLTQNPTTFSTSSSGLDFEPYIVSPNKQNTFDIKEEAKMGLVFPPKVSDELFIERMSVAVFERHSRLSESKTLDQLVAYRNGYYNITENR